MQKAINIGLAAAVVLLGAGLVASIVTRPDPGMSVAEVQSLLATMQSPQSDAATSSEQPTQDTGDIGQAIEDYLLANPRLLERMSVALETELRAEENERTLMALTALEDEIYNDPDNIVLGNPDGDVTLVEMFDYNCGYCRQVVADVLSLVDEDPNLRVILKEFPILSQGSIDAARIGILVNQTDADYRDFHTTLFSTRGTIDTEAALDAASQLGLDRVPLELDMSATKISDAIQRTYAIAQALGVSGTPTFIIGNEVIPGAISKAELSRRIDNMRTCGATDCTGA